MKEFNVVNIIESATKPMNPGIKIHPGYKVLYITTRKPKAIIHDTIVLSSSCPSEGTVAYVPNKVYEFDFWNEYEGFINANSHLKVEPLDYEKLDGYEYVVDLEDMVLYKYDPIPVAYERRFVLKKGGDIVSEPKKNYYSYH